MRCHYEVLNVSRDADDDEIKKTYRKLALQYHPDKNPDNVEEVLERFREVQAAYDVLSDKQERAWYDKNREAILRGGDDFVDDALDLMQYFNPGIYSGFDDGEKSFFTVFREVFCKLNREEEAHDDGLDDDGDVEVPDFGYSYSDYDTCVKPFYIYWLAYRTKKSFVWKQQYDIRQAANRPTQRLMERENKKVRETARKKRNDEVRALVMYVRKRDKRVQEEVKKMKLQQEEKQKKMKDIQEQQKQDRSKVLEEYEEQAWMAFDDSKLDDIDSHFDQMFGNTMSRDSGSEDDEEEYLFCVACDKNFKSEKALGNHEKSKKHKENVEMIKEQLAEDLFEELHLNDGGTENNIVAGDVNLQAEEDLDSITSSDFHTKSNSKKSKKKRRKEKKQLYTVESSDEEPGETVDDSLNEKTETKIDEKQEEKDEVIIDSICTSETVPTNDCTNQLDSALKDETQVSNDHESEKTENKDSNDLNDSSENESNCNKTDKIKEAKNQFKNNDHDRGRNNDDDEEGETFGCQICTKVFPTRNKLFKHIKAEGHAVLKDGPPSKNKKGKKGKGKR